MQCLRASVGKLFIRTGYSIHPNDGRREYKVSRAIRNCQFRNSVIYQSLRQAHDYRELSEAISLLVDYQSGFFENRFILLLRASQFLMLFPPRTSQRKRRISLTVHVVMKTGNVNIRKMTAIGYKLCPILNKCITLRKA